jgi:hypothetical protein
VLDGSSSSSQEVTNAKSATITMERRKKRSDLARSVGINSTLFYEHNVIMVPIYTSIFKNFSAKKVPILEMIILSAAYSNKGLMFL